MSVRQVIDRDQLRTEALVIARVLDAASGQPRTVLSARTGAPHVFARIASGDYLALGGRPELAMPALASTAYVLDAELSFPDREPLALHFTIPAGSTLPYRAADIEVELPPVTLSGTVRQQVHPYGGIGAAAVAVAGTTPPPELLALRTPLSVAHPAAAALSACNAVANAPATTLRAAAAQGAQSVTLTSVAGCAAGAALAIGSDVDLEHGSIASVDAATHTVQLTAPLRRSRALGAPAVALTVNVAAPAATLARAAQSGDGIAELSAAVGAGLVQIAGPIAELRATGAICDLNGHWAIDGVRAIGRLTLSASAAGYKPGTPLAYDVDYHQPNVIELSLAV